MIKLEESLCNSSVFYSLTLSSVSPLEIFWKHWEATEWFSEEAPRLLINVFEEIPWLLTKDMEVDVFGVEKYQFNSN